MNALLLDPPFKEHYLIDYDGEKAESLREMTAGRRDVHVMEGDCNSLLLNEVFPNVGWKDYRRGLCLLDPYGINVDWEVVETAGRTRSIEIFINFMVMDMNMNVLWRNPGNVDPRQPARMDAFWGDRSWRDAAYRKRETLFGQMDEKTGTEDIVKAYQKRPSKVAGYKYVPKPIPMQNNKGAIVYYLFFAAQKPAAAGIIEDIFNKYRKLIA